MPTQSTDRTTAITYAADFEAWTIKQGVSVTAAESAIYMNFAWNVLMNHGDLLGGGGLPAVRVEGADALVFNAADGHISGYRGVSTEGADTTVVNHGAIVATFSAIGATGTDTSISNSGFMYGGTYGVFCGPQAGLSVTNAGVLQSGGTGIRSQALDTVVQNSGVIEGGSGPAIHLESGRLTNTGSLIGDVRFVEADDSVVDNGGEIRGSVLFAAGDDSYDGRGGLVTGAVHGGDGDDRIVAGGFDDELKGGGDDDLLKGMAGEDTLTGGAGKDRMLGGKGDDVFVFLRVTDSNPGRFDVIAGWDAGDVIDLSALDANTALAGQQHLVFGGLIAAGDPVVAGQVQYYKQGGDTYVVADVNGDGLADFRVQIAGNVTLTASDFEL